MVDLGKNEIDEEIDEEINEEINEEVNEEINEEINIKINVEVNVKVGEEVDQVAISNVEPTKILYNQVTNLNKTVTNKQYGILELIGLSFKYVNKNIGKFFMYLFMLLVATLIFIMPISVMAYDLEAYNKGNIGLIITIVIMFVSFVMICVWLLAKTVTSIDTGIKRIEWKKYNMPMGKSFWRLCGLQFLMTALSFSMYALVELTAEAVVIYVWLTIQMQIFGFLLTNYTIFGYYEIVAKGENVSNSLANAFTNLFFSKNGIILKSFVGDLLLWITGVVIVCAMIFFNVFKGAFSSEIKNVALVNGIGTILAIVLFLIVFYVSFVSMMYTYLVYMLNEVRDDKVDDLR